MNFIKNRSLLFLLLLGLFIRLAMIYYDASWDVNNHLVWARDLWNRGPVGFFETQSSNVFAYRFPNYPPLAIAIFALVYPLADLFHDFFWQINLAIPFFPSKLIFFMESEVFLKGFMKLPGIIGDLSITYLAYLFVKKLAPQNKKSLLIIPSLILFNPAFIFNSALWGQIDSLPILFVLLAVYWLMFKKNYLLTAGWFLLALLIKPTALVFLPLFAIFYYRKYGLKNSLLALFVCNLVLWLSFLPFFKDGNLLLFPYQTYYYGILQAQSLPFVTNGAFNFWVLLTQFKEVKDVAPFLLGISYRFWGYLIVGTLNIWLILKSLRSKDKLSLFYGLFFSALTAFLFLTKMHERYSLLPLVFLLFFYLEDKKMGKWFVILSLISFLNHYHSWAVPRVEPFVNFLNSPAVFIFLSFINVFVLFFLLLRSSLQFKTKRSRIAP